MKKGKFRNKEEISQVLMKSGELPSGLVEVSPLQTYVLSARPDYSLYMKLIARCLLYIALGSCVIIYTLLKYDFWTVSLYATAAIMGLCTGLVIQQSFRLKDCREKLKAAISAPLNELHYLADYLETYLKDLDRRTSRHFEMVTTNKISNQILLSNLSAVLTRKSAEIQAVLDRGNSYYDLLQIDLCLRSELKISDSVPGMAGKMYLIAVSLLPQTIDLLVHNMELAVRDIDMASKIDYRSTSGRHDIH